MLGREEDSDLNRRTRGQEDMMIDGRLMIMTTTVRNKSAAAINRLSLSEPPRSRTQISYFPPFMTHQHVHDSDRGRRKLRGTNVQNVLFMYFRSLSSSLPDSAPPFPTPFLLPPACAPIPL